MFPYEKESEPLILTLENNIIFTKFSPSTRSFLWPYHVTDADLHVRFMAQLLPPRNGKSMWVRVHVI